MDAEADEVEEAAAVSVTDAEGDDVGEGRAVTVKPAVAVPE